MFALRSMSASCNVHRVQTHALASSSSTAPAATVQHASKLPATYKRLVAKRTGKSFKEVAEVEEVPLPQPGDNEVGGCLADHTTSLTGSGTSSSNGSSSRRALVVPFAARCSKMRAQAAEPAIGDQRGVYCTALHSVLWQALVCVHAPCACGW